MFEILFNYFDFLNVLLILLIGFSLFLIKNKSKEDELNKLEQEEIIDSIPRRSEECPQQYPNGWLPVFDSHELKKGEVKPIFALGRDLVIYRGTSGKTYVFDAYCPHLGANLGVGGTVVGDDIKCHFHGWQFNNQGDCKLIPGLDDKVPRVTIKKWRCDEVNHMIYVWHHLDEKEPDWFMIKHDQIDRLYYMGKLIKKSYCHIQDIAENEADLVHLETLHGQENLVPKLLKNLIKIKPIWKSTWTICDPPNTHCTYFEFKLDIKIGFLRLPPWSFYGKHCGPSNMIFKVDFQHLFKTSILVNLNSITFGPMKQLMIFKLYSEPSILSFVLVRAVIPLLSHFVSTDIYVWNRQRFLKSPKFSSKSDQYLSSFRRWYKQKFY